MQLRLEVFGSFSLADAEGRRLDIGRSGAQLFALLALAGRGVAREQLASTLWPAKTNDRARANLRSVMWRLPVLARRALLGQDDQLRLSPDTSCDLSRLRAGLREDVEHLEHYAQPLLPGWYDGWIIEHREQVALTQLETFEERGEAALRRGDFVSAIECGLLAVSIEPLKERAHQIVLRGHLGQENVDEASRHFVYLEGLLKRELGVCPTRETHGLLCPTNRAR